MRKMLDTMLKNAPERPAASDIRIPGEPGGTGTSRARAHAPRIRAPEHGSLSTRGPLPSSALAKLGFSTKVSGLRALVLRAVAGRGGPGCVSFARARFRRVGPPDGGTGGDGGNVIVQVSASVSCLPSHRHVVVVRAENGVPGQRWERSGRRGKDVRFVVPPGTWLRWLRDPSTIDSSRPHVFLNLNDTEDDLRMNDAVQALSALEPSCFARNDASDSVNFDVDDGAATSASSDFPASVKSAPAHVLVKSSVIAAAGGKGGHGNTFYQSSVNRSPKQAQAGLEGAEQLVLLERLPVADIAIVGAPNAGKSSLLATLTRARPEIAPTPYTTTEPMLGVLEDHQTWMRSILVEIPSKTLEDAQQSPELVWHLFRACRHVVAVVDHQRTAGNTRLLREQVRALQRMVAPRVLAGCVVRSHLLQGQPQKDQAMPQHMEGVALLTRLADVRQALLKLTTEPPWVLHTDNEQGTRHSQRMLGR